MKALHVIPSVAARYGGPSRAVREMCLALGRQGVSTLIATTDADGKGRLPVELGRPIPYGDVPTIFFPRQWTEAYKYSRPLASWLDQHVGEFDVVHIHAVFSHSSQAAASACRRQGVPYIVRPLGTLDPWSLRQKPVRKRAFWHLGVRRMLTGAAAIHYTTRAEQELAQDSLGLVRGVVIPLGIELESPIGPEETGNPAEPVYQTPYVLVLSRLHPKKGLELLLRAFLSLSRRPEFKDWKIILAGDGEAAYVQSLRRLVENESGNGNAIFAGWVEGRRKQVILERASLLALTSHQENFGLCVLEALACGVPVLVSPEVNLAPEIVEAGAGWVSPLEETAIEQMLAEALLDNEGRRRRGAAGRRLVGSHFQWSAVASQLVDMYERVSNQTPLRAVSAHA